MERVGASTYRSRGGGVRPGGWLQMCENHSLMVTDRLGKTWEARLGH
jgi:hypothetical protein